MSYIQIEIGGRVRGLKFNQYAHIIVQEKIDPDHSNASINSALIYGGLKGNCYVKGEEPDFTFEQVCDWIEELPEDVMLSVYNVYMNTTAFLKAKEASEDKKKAEQLISQPTDQSATESPVAD